MERISIPPVPDFRAHILFLCFYLKCYDSLIEQGSIPEQNFHSYLTNDKVDTIIHLLTEADPKTSVPVTPEQFIAIYICYHLSTKVILSHYDEQVYNFLISYIPGFKSLGNFSTIRKEIVARNAYLIQDTEIKFPESDEIKQLSQQLSLITLP